MAEFDFYGTLEDSWALLEELAATNRFTFLIDMALKEQKPYEFSVLTEEVKQTLQKHPKVFLWSDEYSRFPLHFLQSSGGFFHIYPLKGGPLLELSLPRAVARESRIRLVGGDLMHQTSYGNAETGGIYAAPEELRRVYRQVKNLLRENLVKRYAQVRMVRNGNFLDRAEAVWIGHNALALLETGKAEIQIAGEWLEGKDLHSQ